MFTHQADEEDYCVVELIDFLRGRNEHSPLIGMLKQKLRSPKRIAFSNKFEEFKCINCTCDVYDVRISRACSVIVAVTGEYFLFIDYETLEPKGRVATESFYFELEEDYDQCGNDALLLFYDKEISKYDLKQFIEEKGCKPLWTYSNEIGYDTSEPINVMVLDGKKAVVFNSQNSMGFLDAKNGTLLDYTIKLEGAISGCFEADRKKPNTLYIFLKEMIKFEYENGDWKRTSFSVNIRSVDGLCMDRESGVLYFSGYCDGKCYISAYTTSGDLIAMHSVNCAGICIDERTGLMYLADGNKISILR
ncbi:predicted protein [Naegleria gruberi]|uniref:Predicted protein n=1 Tax=Naegleria gruberi TaxID=5762 RepID=D2VNT7_NAEGR|nr:uncharacterized protein NAEGRDRAFT_70614 [Naegleria gruberi]EFC41471.1 predicted protein [Naegleria gruberi]|eukprot:XP_002674215.1 predicted protein [Naegleria gruberi strain NEG-M]